MTALQGALYLFAAGLPIAGFGRLLWRVQRRIDQLDRRTEERGYSHSSWQDLEDGSEQDIREPLWQERRDLIWDLILVGLGLSAGALASILQLTA